MSSAKYIVIAGDERPPYIEAQQIEKGTGQTILTGEKVLLSIRRGELGFPNRSEIWGARRVDGKIPATPVDVKNTDYKGDIEILPWGDPKGCLIIARYLKGYNTLDMQYQNLVLNADDNIDDTQESSSDAYYMTLLSGENVFDESKEPYKVKFLKATKYNQNSTSKDPEFHSYMFKEKNEKEEVLISTEEINHKISALNLVADASSDNTSAKIKNLKTIVSELIPEDIKDENLYSYLLKVADTKPDLFMGCIQKYKISFSKTIELAKSHNVIDWTKDGILAAGKEKREIIAQDIPAKGAKMLDWCFENFLDPKSNQVAFQLKKITDKF